ncbi:amino acid permease/ SLC12A domain-containing protein [Ilyonectria destructans]|nr:amino acid permease/ SLC12A domain-containing protein [Ilyonectria destructans]
MTTHAPSKTSGDPGDPKPDIPMGLTRILSCRLGDSAETAGMTDLVQTETKRNIKSRHAQMLALGGTIGTGLFVGTGQALSVSGPVNLFLAYSIICIFVYGIVLGVAEAASYLPLPGSSMAFHASRYVSQSLGFAMGWLYWYSFGILIAYEITAASLIINYWDNPVPVAVWITIMMVVIVLLNTAPVRVYAETEFWFASVKVIMIMGLLILAVVLCLGGGPQGGRIGFSYWNNPRPMNEYLVDGALGRFCAFIYAIAFSSFAFSFGPELIVVTGGEMDKPRSNMPTAAKNFAWRLLAFYALGSLAISVICRSNAPGLTNGGSGAAASPWVIAIKEAGIKALDSIINAGIIISAWSSGNSFLYMSSRSLYSMAKIGNAPAIFARCNRYGVPLNAVLTSALFAPLAYLNVGTSSSIVFNWFVNLTNTAGFTSWICCSIVLIRFRRACDAQGVTNIPYKSPFQPYLAWTCMVIFAMLLLLNGFSVFFTGHWSVTSFLTAYLGAPIFLVIYFFHRITHWSDAWAIDPMEVDLRTGLDEFERMEHAENYESEEKVKPGFHWKVYRIIKSLWE